MPSDAGAASATARLSARQAGLLAAGAARAVPAELTAAAADFDRLAGALCRRIIPLDPPGSPAVSAQASCFMSLVARIDAEDRADAAPPRRPGASRYGGDPMFRMLERCAPAWPAFITGRTRGVDVVFPKGDRRLWAHMQARSLHMQGFAAAASAAVCALIPGARQILEIGAGSGAATAALLSQAGGTVSARYLVTDISPTLLRDIQASFSAARLEYAAYDFTRAAPALGQFDIVFGANALHCAADVRAALGNVLGLVASGGYLVLAEGARPPSGRVWRPELIFSLLPGWWEVDTDPRTRPDVGFLTDSGWRRLFHEAGCPDVVVLPIGTSSSAVVGSLIVTRKG
jgi:SAM-dependent methyltransferase